MRRAGAIGALALACVLMQVPAQAAVTGTQVSMHNLTYDPPSFTQTFFGFVGFANHETSVRHTVTSDIGLFDSSPNHPADDIAPGSGFTPDLEAAGIFVYHCKVHSFMHGQIVVVLQAPASATKGGTFDVRWAGSAVPSGFNEDVQVKIPGSRRFTTFKSDQRGSQVNASFTPKKKGTYSFRARLQNEATGGVSRFSPLAKVFVS